MFHNAQDKRGSSDKIEMNGVISSNQLSVKQLLEKNVNLFIMHRNLWNGTIIKYFYKECYLKVKYEI